MACSIGGAPTSVKFALGLTKMADTAETIGDRTNSAGGATAAHPGRYVKDESATAPDPTINSRRLITGFS